MTAFGAYTGPESPVSGSIPTPFGAAPQFATGGGGSRPIPAAKVLAAGTTGALYSETIDETQGGVSPYTFAVTSGALPTGLSLNSSTGVISGTPSVAGTFNFTITVTDANGSTGSTPFQIIIATPAGAGGSFVFG